MPRQTRPMDGKRPADARLRKKRTSRKPSISLAGRKYNKTLYTPPPVLVRREILDRTTPDRKGSKHRRRYDVALNVPGAEVRLPALPEVRFGWRLLSGLLVVLLAGALYYLASSPRFRVQAAELKGLQRVKLADVDTVVNVSDEPIFMVNPAQIYQSLQEAFPEMSAITVEVGLPAIVRVSVKERQPVLDWRQEGREFWVDAQGVTFPPRGDAGALVAVEGNIPATQAISGTQTTGHLLNPGIISAILTLSTQAPPNTPMVYDPEHGLGWKDERGWQVYFGMDLENMSNKLKVYQALVDRLMQDGIQPVLISVEYLHAPYYRLEQ